jgi:hypothetical protein
MQLTSVGIPATKETSMRFYTKTHKHYCGIDLHARYLIVSVERIFSSSANLRSPPIRYRLLTAGGLISVRLHIQSANISRRT